MPTQLKLHERPKSVHPFPARMAPEIVLQALHALRPGSVVVDPMCGSGVVLREAVQQGHLAIGFDVDPLAVLMSKVWTHPLDTSTLIRRGEAIVKAATDLTEDDIVLPWIDGDKETAKFIDFWFADRQKEPLCKLAHLMAQKRGPVNRALQLAISRLIVTKKNGASLAWDVSHSRPHRVKLCNEYDVLSGFKTAVSFIAVEARKIPPKSTALVRIGNARRLTRIANEYADIVITSPPYMNAIDYIRGHRLALVWLGYPVAKLRRIRSSAVGKENALSERAFKNIGLSTSFLPSDLDNVTLSHVRRYAFDMVKVIAEIARILKPSGRAVLVVASSRIRGKTIDNPQLIASIANYLGLRQIECVEREIPTNRRYLPPPTSTIQESLKKRMRTESILTFEKAVRISA